MMSVRGAGRDHQTSAIAVIAGVCGVNVALAGAVQTPNSPPLRAAVLVISARVLRRCGVHTRGAGVRIAHTEDEVKMIPANDDSDPEAAPEDLSYASALDADTLL